MRKIAAAALACLALLAGCTAEEPNVFDGFRAFEPGEILHYRVQVKQKRTASGLGEPKTLTSKVILDIEEEPTETGFAIVIRKATASGESTQITAARRLEGRRIGIDLKEGAYVGVVELFSGGEDLAAADIGLLHTLFAPLIPKPRSETGEKWRAKTPQIKVPWAQEPIAFTVDHEITGSDELRMLEVARVQSQALTNVRFRMPLVEQRPAAAQTQPGASNGEQTFIVNELFENLFADIDNPVEGAFAAIAAIPLAIAAPFVAFGEALGGLFGGGSDEPSQPQLPEIPVVDLAGPVQITSASAVWRADGRILEASGKGTSSLVGTLPQLSGGASELSGKPLTLKTWWAVSRKLTSPWPEPRPTPGRPLGLLLLAAFFVLAGAVASSWRVLDARQRGTDTFSPVTEQRERESVHA